MTLLEFLKLLRKRLWLLVFLPLAIGIGTVLVTRSMPDQYTAETSMYVLARTETPEGTYSSSQYLDLSAAQMLSNDVAALITSKRVQSDVATQLGLESLSQYNFEITNSSTTRVITLDVTGPSAEGAAAVANAIVADVSNVAASIMSVQSVNVIDSATVPTGPSGPRRNLYVAGGVFVGSVLAIVIIVLMDAFDTRVRSDDDIEKRTEAPIVAHYQQLRGNLLPRNRTTRTSQAIDNSSKTLLANVRFMNVDNPVRTIIITSAVPNEGKTFVSANLAQAIATSGKTVLVVECDMRRRSMSGSLGIHPEHGLYAVISGEVPLTTAAIQTSTKGMFFLDAEPHIPNPSDLLNSKGFSRLIDEASQVFDYVIFDTPPVGTFIDAAVLGRKVDATLMVVREGVVHREEVTQAVNQLRKAGVNLAGVVMNGCEANNSEKYYRYYSKGRTGSRGKKRRTDGATLVPASEVADSLQSDVLDNGPQFDTGLASSEK